MIFSRRTSSPTRWAASASSSTILIIRASLSSLISPACLRNRMRLGPRPLLRHHRPTCYRGNYPEVTRLIKKILVGIATSEHSRNAQAYAFYFARIFNASLIGLHVVDIVSIEGSFFHDISGSLGLEPYLDFSSKMREVLTARGRGVLDEFAAAARRENLAVETVLDMGIVANQICERARSTDLVMIGHRGVNEKFSTGLLGSTAESVARKSPRQMLISPKRFREVKRPVLAYDGSERASRAMRSAAEVANGLGVPVTVVTCARDPKLGERTLAEART